MQGSCHKSTFLLMVSAVVATGNDPGVPQPDKLPGRFQLGSCARWNNSYRYSRSSGFLLFPGFFYSVYASLKLSMIFFASS